MMNNRAVRSAVVAICAIQLSGCQPKAFTWKDTTGKDRNICIAVENMNACDRIAGWWKEDDPVKSQDAYDRLLVCMKKRGWVLADSWQNEEGPLNCPKSGKVK